jgi:hypothetical protein
VGIGAGIFLLAIGAILTFAVETTVAGIDIDVIGIILMLAGAFGLLMSLLVWGPRSSAGGGTTVVTRERDIL